MNQNYLNKITCGDSIEVMKNLDDASVDLICTSPPYNLRQSSGNGFKSTGKNKKWTNAEIKNGYDGFDDMMPHDEYVKWQKECLTEMMRLIKDDGAIFYNHKWRVQSGLIQDRQDIVKDFPVRQIIIWQRAGGMNFNDGYFVPTYEVIYLICKPKFKLAKKANGMGDVWKINQERNTNHPAPFPIELPLKIIGATNAKIILDPFSGIGTTSLAACKLNRDYIGIEKSQKYCDIANSRISDFMKERDNPSQQELPFVSKDM